MPEGHDVSSDGRPAYPLAAEEATPGDNLTRRTVSGVRWTYLQTVISAVLQIVMAGVLARLLPPAAFGLVALGNLVLRFVDYFAKGGIGQAVVQKPDLTEMDVRASFTMSMVLGATFAAVIWVAAPLAAAVFDTPDVVPVVRYLSLGMLLQGIGSTADALLNRQMRFRTLAIRNITSYVVGYVGVGLPLALLDFGVYALVAAILTQALVAAVLTFAAAPHPVRPATERSSYRAIFGFGSRVSVTGFFEFLGSNADTVAVGRFAGAGPLGFYNRANLIGELPVYYLSTSLSEVLFPAFSAVQEELDRLRSAYLSTIGVAAAVVLPTAAGMAVASRELVLVLLGDDWLQSVPVLPWLAGASAVAMVNHFGAVLAEAQAALNAKIAISASKVAVLVGLLLLAAGGSLSAYAAALGGAAVYAHVCYVALISRTLRTPWTILVRPYLRPALTAALTAGAIAGVRYGLLRLGVGVAPILAAEVLTGGVVVLLALRVGPLGEVRRDAMQRLDNAGVLDSKVGRVLRWSLGHPRSDVT